jgi:excinuclease ABC subunit C
MDRLPLLSRLEENRAAARRCIPVCPGVYGWLNADGALIYVGKAKSLRHRLTGYFATRTSDPKMARIRRNSATLVWEPISHELLALLREQELIDRFRPPWNVQGQPERRQPGFVCLGRGVAPGFWFASHLTRQAQIAAGPIAGRGEMRAAVSALNYVFRLRDCPAHIRMRFNNQLQLFDTGPSPRCLRFELASCLGPCTGGCSRQTYEANVKSAAAFLAGTDWSVLRQLETQMNQAAAAMAFERAQVLRDQLHHLNWLARRIRQLNAARKTMHGVWMLPGFDRQEHWLFLEKGFLRRCASRPEGSFARNDASLVREAPAVASESNGESPSTGPEAPPVSDDLAVEWFLLMASWSRRNPDQLDSIARTHEPSGGRSRRRICA